MKDDILMKAQLDGLVKLQAEIADLQGRLIPADRDSNPGVTQRRTQIGGIQGIVDREKELKRPIVEKQLRAKALDDLVSEAAKITLHMEGAKSQLVMIRKKIGEVDAQIVAMRLGVLDGGKLIGDVDGPQAEVNALDAEIKKSGEELAGLESSLPLTPRLTVAEAAAPPMGASTDKRMKAAAGAFLGLFGLVFLGVASTEFRTRRVYQAEDVSQGLGMPLLGTLPPLSAKARSAAPVADDECIGPMIESMDGIRSRLLYAGRSETLRVIIVGSAVSGEGKTTLASHLAASLARGGRRTLLVDGDLRNPAAHKLFGMSAGPGFSELLRGEVEPRQVVQNTPLENLSLLAAGACDRQALQALAQEGILRNVFDELKEQYDFLIVDVSPVLPVADALLIGEHADAALLSVLSNVSRLPAVHAAQQRLSSLGIRVLGAIVIGEATDSYGQIHYPARSGRQVTVPFLRGPISMMRNLTFAAGLTIVIASGFVYGAWTQRWQASTALETAVAALNALPEQVGPWKAAPAELDKDALDMAGAKGWWVRRFTNGRTGASVMVILLCGRAGPMSVHKPETCYTGAGFSLTASPVRTAIHVVGEDAPAEFWTGVFKKPEAGGQHLRIFWSWFDGRAWRAAENPRWSFAQLPALYKLYIIRETSGRPERFDKDPAAELLRGLLPDLTRTLAAP